ncbi:hypothetical protein [Streptacidiphilus jiangxiensis]|uniref:Uncharacterized protein n=1 Tax=Streptacidiphilus jiangxiensis TaxID=235985 RepID=A0A1H7NS26_STRJI|nr:hypothetical protein [Streptacidiphilus jiangxiensis]SEL26171.1 hypothetical protein SAMN05414137_10745 [Streptacidiphilus jiangxiensis]
MEKFRGFNVSNVRGDGVVVEVYEADLDAGAGSKKPVAERVALTWADLAALGAEYDVPVEYWAIADDAMELLGPEPEQAPGDSA